MSPDDREDIEDTRPHGDLDDGETEDTLREIPAGEPRDDETYENSSGGDTLIQGDDGRTRSTRKNPTPAPLSGQATEPRTPAPPPAGSRRSPGAEIELERAEILGERAEVFAGRFEVLKTIGQGGMGRVYAVRDRQIEGRKVALKILLPKFSKNEDFRRLFFDEIRANQKFVSEYVVQIRDTGQASDGHLFLTMDLVDGVSLSGLIKREGALQPRHGLEIARQVLLGLQPGHEKGIIHRDIKPSNVMLVSRTPKTEDNPFGVAVRLLDFGIAAIASDLTPGQIIGTPQYMSPEQLEGERLDQRSDLFSVGVLLYEMISGKRPFGGTTLQEISRALRETQIPDLVRNLEGLPKPIQKVLHKALQKDRKKRYQSAAEFIAAIEGSSAFKEPTKVPAWSSILLVLMTGVAAVEGYHITTTQARALSNEALREELDASKALVASLRGEKADLADSLNEQVKANNELARSKDALQKKLDDRQDDSTVQVDFQSQIDDLLAKVETWRDNAEEARKERDALKAANDELDRQVQELSYLKSEESNRARVFDTLLGDLEALHGLDAAEILQYQINESVFRSNRDGTAFLRSLIDTVIALEEGRIEAARRKLLQATSEGRVEGFLTTAGPYLRAAAPDSGETPEQALTARQERLSRFLAFLEGEVAQREQEFAARLEASAAEREEQLADLRTKPPREMVEVAIGLHQEFGEDLSDYLARAADELERSSVVGGHLQPEKVLADPFMQRLHGYLQQDGADLQGAPIDRLNRLWAAAQWYQSGTPLPDRLRPREPVSLTTSEPHHDWAALLALQSQFVEQRAWPPTRDDVFVYRIDRGGDRVWWRVDRSAGRDSVSQTTYQGAIKAGEDEHRVERTPTGFVLDGTEAIDLNDTDSRVALWDPSFDPRPSQDETWARSMEFEDFQGRATESAVPCVVVQTATGELWLSPRFGMVRLVASKSSLELVFNSAVR